MAMAGRRDGRRGFVRRGVVVPAHAGATCTAPGLCRLEAARRRTPARLPGRSDVVLRARQAGRQYHRGGGRQFVEHDPPRPQRHGIARRCAAAHAHGRRQSLS